MGPVLFACSLFKALRGDIAEEITLHSLDKHPAVLLPGADVQRRSSL